MQCCGNYVVGCLICFRMSLECQLSVGLSQREEGVLIIDLPWPFRISGYRWELPRKIHCALPSGMFLCQCIHINASEAFWQVLLSLVLMCYWNKFWQAWAQVLEAEMRAVRCYVGFRWGSSGAEICIPADNCFLHTIHISSISLKWSVSCNSCRMCNLYWMWTSS